MSTSKLESGSEPGVPPQHELQTGSSLPELSPSTALRLRSLTPARVGLRRTGVSLATTEVLEFQLAHGRARDAIHAALQLATLLPNLRNLTTPSLDVLVLHSAAANRQTYLQRPDLGRKLDEPSRARLREHPHPEPYDLSIVIVDGLSALAVERQAAPLLAELLPSLAAPSPLRLAPLCVVEQGRVAIGDEVAHALSASLVIVLIGERPGLSSPDSLGAYITWQPYPGRTDAERNCISNIRAGGLSYEQAAARLLYFIHEARRRQLTGVGLKDAELLLDPGHQGAS
jgi:ethanolamine ammonia-lyase small subunit